MDGYGDSLPLKKRRGDPGGGFVTKPCNHTCTFRETFVVRTVRHSFDGAAGLVATWSV